MPGRKNRCRWSRDTVLGMRTAYGVLRYHRVAHFLNIPDLPRVHYPIFLSRLVGDQSSLSTCTTYRCLQVHVRPVKC